METAYIVWIRSWNMYQTAGRSQRPVSELLNHQIRFTFRTELLWTLLKPQFSIMKVLNEYVCNLSIVWENLNAREDKNAHVHVYLPYSGSKWFRQSPRPPLCMLILNEQSSSEIESSRWRKITRRMHTYTYPVPIRYTASPQNLTAPQGIGLAAIHCIWTRTCITHYYKSCVYACMPIPVHTTLQL